MKLLFLDIETAPAVAYVWSLFKQNIGIDQIISPTRLLCFSAKWHDSEEMMFHKSAKEDGRDFDRMVRAAHALLSEADAVCHYNGSSFDVPRLNQEFLRVGLKPPPPVAQIDLYRTVASKFSLTSNKLAFVGPYLKIGEKVKHEGWGLWTACLAGDKDAWERMEAYNKQDVLLLEQLYEKILPWIDGHPNAALFVDNDKPICPTCGSERIHRRGSRYGITLSYARFVCLDCGRWSRARFHHKQHDTAAKLR